MKKFTKIGSLIAAFCILAVAFIGCGAKEEPKASDSDKKTITIGCMPLNQEAVETIAQMLEPKGYTVETVVFDGNNLPAQALAAGEIDSLILNHLPWIKTFNSENNTNLVMADGFSYASILGLYSSKYKTIDEIPSGAKIIISNDPSNMERSLKLLEKVGLIKLGEKMGEFTSVLDIAENSKNIQFVEVETTSTAGGFEDADATISFSSVMKNAGYDAFSFIEEDGKHVDYPCGLVVADGNQDAQWVKDIVAVTQTPEYKAKFDEIFQGAYRLL